MKELTNFITLLKNRKAAINLTKIAVELGISRKSIYNIINNHSGKKVFIDGRRNVFTHDHLRTKIYKMLDDNQKEL